MAERRATGSVVVDAPVEKVYEYWSNLENLPRFVTGVEDVRRTGPKETHWVVKGPLGATIEFDARTVRDEPGAAVAWAAEGGGAAFSGEARFEEVAPGITRVEFSAGPGKPGSSLSNALRRFARIIEGRARGDEERLRVYAPPTLEQLAPHRAGARREPGSFRGRLVAGPDFDDPLPEDLLRAFEGTDGDPIGGSSGAPN